MADLAGPRRAGDRRECVRRRQAADAADPDAHAHAAGGGGTTISHVYGARGLFVVTVTASTAGGASATASLPNVAATTVDGRWGLQDATGTFIVRNTSLNQNATAIAGDDTALNCRFAVTGSVRAQRAITLTWTRARNDCQAFNVPEVITVTGVAEEAVNGFLGTLDTGAPASLVVCSRPSCF
jgi:hypothetical protein